MVSYVKELAIFGGPPRFPEPLHVGRPNIGDRRRLAARLEAMLDRRWLTNDGPLVPEFEEEVARRAGVSHCVATCNATSGLQLAIHALGMSGEVIVPAFTFVAPVHALAWLGITPVFCDIDPVTHLIDVDQIEALINERTTGILAVHVWGQACNTERLESIAGRHGLRLLFDAAHAFGCRDRGRPTGSAGDAEVFSFHATKVVNAFEGGAIVTDDAALANHLRAARSFGFTGEDRVAHLGVNAKMTEASAAMGLTSLEAMEEFVSVNRRHYGTYYRELSTLAGIRMRSPEALADTTFHYVVLDIDPDEAGFDRNLALELLTAEGVLARRYFYPGCHRMEPYRSRKARRELPVTDRVCGRVLQLPTGTGVSREDVEAVCQLIQCLSAHAVEVRERLSVPRVSSAR